ncbi:MAG: pitrilysin family protein [Solirubrobacteraceae bacterium]|nr:pitrilysin family protein [Solirubrobacteraceae bacterium]
MSIAISSTQAPKGLPIHKVALPGTRALTIMVAFDAGSRSERPEENGIAHFLEHLVFKGGEKYPHYRDVNGTAERMGGMLNAFTSQDMVAFHITVRAERAPDAIDLLTDFVGRPHIDADELDKERGVVIQEIQRADDQPSSIASDLIDKAAFGDHPLGRTILGPEEHLRTFTRDQIVAFRDRQWSPTRGGAYLVGNLDFLPDDAALGEFFDRFPDPAKPESNLAYPGLTVQTLVGERDTNQSHLRLVYEPKIDVTNTRERAALRLYGSILGGSMSSRLFDELREQRGLCYSVWGFEHVHADGAQLALGAGLESAKAVEAYRRMREIVNELAADGPTADELELARSYASGRHILATESSGAVARLAASQTITFGEDIDPDRIIETLDSITLDEVAAVAASVADEAAVACVGPHTVDEFAWDAT